jgi:hypothetical protein
VYLVLVVIANDNVCYLYLYGLTCPVAAYVAGMDAKMD